MVIDTRKCIACHACTVACRVNNELPIDMIYNPVTTVGPEGKFPHLRMLHIPLLCMHCGNAPCVSVCPTGASIQRNDGIVWIDEKKCVSCKACIMACPYGARISNDQTGTVQKCDFCKDERVDQGFVPYCVQTCHQNARIFGDIEDTESEVFRLINTSKTKGRLLEDLGTEPGVYYLY